MTATDKRPNNQDPLAFLAGGGEMGERVRSFDWSKTPLGPLEHWSPSLKTAVRIVLGSRYQMFVWWGEDLINIYNDAYAPLLGQRHPNAGTACSANLERDLAHHRTTGRSKGSPIKGVGCLCLEDCDAKETFSKGSSLRTRPPSRLCPMPCFSVTLSMLLDPLIRNTLRGRSTP